MKVTDLISIRKFEDPANVQTTKQIATIIGMSIRRTREIITKQIEQGTVEMVWTRTKDGRPVQAYRLTAKGRK